jgi:hypothetical protein
VTWERVDAEDGAFVACPSVDRSNPLRLLASPVPFSRRRRTTTMGVPPVTLSRDV